MAPPFDARLWRGAPLTADPSASEGLAAFLSAVRLFLALGRLVCIAVAVSSFSGAAQEFTSYLGSANTGLGKLCFGLGALALAYALPRLSDVQRPVLGSP